MSNGLFHIYTNPRTEGEVLAVKVTRENMEQLLKSKVAVGGTSDHLIVQDPTGRAEIAELGDYIVSDMAGGYKAVEKENFEPHYTR